MPDPVYRTWMIFYIDPTEPHGAPWRTAGMIGGHFTADEAIARTVGLRFPDRPFWAFALDKGDHVSFYDLHNNPHSERRIGPAGYAAMPRAIRCTNCGKRYFMPPVKLGMPCWSCGEPLVQAPAPTPERGHDPAQRSGEDAR